jgi:hypothetical protein
MVSPQSIAPLCESTSLKRLNLSNLSLNDDHFLTIAEKVAGNSESHLVQLILNLNHNTDLGLDMILMQLLNKDDGTSSSSCFSSSTIKTFQAYQKDRIISQATYDHLKGVLKRNVALTNLRVHTISNKTLDFYVQLNKAGRRRLLDTQHTTWSQWVKLLENAANKSPDLLFYCLRESTFWWKCIYFMALGGETAPSEDGDEEARPWHHKPSFEGVSDDLQTAKDDPQEVPESVPPNAVEVDSDNEKDKVADGTGDILMHLEEMGLSEMFDVAHDDHESRASIVSFGDDTYVLDLVRQKEDREGLRHEEALEDALELYEIAKVEANLQEDSDELFKAIFLQVRMELDKQRREKDKAHDELVERELYLKRVQNEQEDMKKKKDARRQRSPTRGRSPVQPPNQQGPPGAKLRPMAQPRKNGNPARRPNQRPDGKAPPPRKNASQSRRPNQPTTG